MDTSSTRARGGRLRRAVGSLRRHPAVTVVLLAAVAAGLAFSVLVGMDPAITLALMAVVGAGAVGLWRWWHRRRSGAVTEPAMGGRMALVAVAASGLVTMVAIQVIPYGRDHSNPPVTGEPDWADDRTRQLMVDACFACHSNEVEYPAHASIAPISWTTQRHVEEGRDAVNYSEYATDPGDAEESVEVVEEGEMPPGFFTRFGLHPEARLSEEELAALIAGLRATPGLSED